MLSSRWFPFIAALKSLVLTLFIVGRLQCFMHGISGRTGVLIEVLRKGKQTSVSDRDMTTWRTKIGMGRGSEVMMGAEKYRRSHPK